jgi:hypothetical protein
VSVQGFRVQRLAVQAPVQYELLISESCGIPNKNITVLRMLRSGSRERSNRNSKTALDKGNLEPVNAYDNYRDNKQEENFME